MSAQCSVASSGSINLDIELPEFWDGCEFFYYRSWEGVTFEEFVAELGAYIEYYNEGRIKQSLGWKSPMQYRKSLGLAA